MPTSARNFEELRRVELAERERFVAARPRSLRLEMAGGQWMPNGTPMSWMAATYRHPPMFIASGAGNRIRDVDGNELVDFNLADMSMFCGYAPKAITDAIVGQSRLGVQFM